MDDFEHQCRHCIRSSVVIDALCDKIKSLESQVARATSDALYQPAGKKSTDDESLSQSLSSNNTLIEPTAKDHTYILRTAPHNDPPLIDLLDGVVDGYQDGLSPDKPAVSRTDVASKKIDFACNVHSFAYIQHFAKSSVQAKPFSKPTSPMRDVISTESSSSQLSGASVALSLHNVPGTETGPAAADSAHRKDGPQKQSSLLKGLEHSIWAPKQVLQEPVHDDPLLKGVHVSSAKGLAKEPLGAQNYMMSPLAEIETRHIVRVSEDRLEAPLNGVTKGIEYHVKDAQRFSSCPIYPMGFKPSAGNREVYRTVCVSGLKRGFSISQVLSQVRGGIVVDAKLMNTSKLLGSTSALITFLDQISAEYFENCARKHFIQNAGFEFTANILATPTWPLAKGLELAVRDQGHSRCLRLSNCPKTVSASNLRKHLEGSSTTNMSNIEDIMFNPDGIVEIRFSSINAAQQAFAILTTLRYPTNGRKLEYARDPCAQLF